MSGKYEMFSGQNGRCRFRPHAATGGAMPAREDAFPKPPRLRGGALMQHHRGNGSPLRRPVANTGPAYVIFGADDPQITESPQQCRACRARIRDLAARQKIGLILAIGEPGE